MKNMHPSANLAVAVIVLAAIAYLLRTLFQSERSPVPREKTEDQLAKQTEEWVKSQCNRYVNGHCSSTVCLLRGGYFRCEKPDYNMATCEAHEVMQKLQSKR